VLERSQCAEKSSAIFDLSHARFQRPARVAVQSAIGANMEDMFGMITLLLIALGIGAVFFWVYRPMR
jgi:hypothetical protein